MANGLLDMLGGAFGATPPSYIEGLLGAQATEDLRKRSIGSGLVNALVGYAAMPKNQNLGLGRILAGAAQAGMAGAQGVYDTATRDYMMQQRIAEMQRAKKLQESQDAFRANIGQPNATRNVITQPTEQVPVAPVEGAVAPNFETQAVAPVVTQEQYYDPSKMIEEGLKSGALDIKDYLSYATKAKAGSQILTPDQVKMMNLPTDRGQVYQRDLTTNKIDMIEGTLKAEPKSAVEILTTAQAKALNLPTGRGQVYQKDKVSNKVDLIEGTLAPVGGEGGVGGAGGVDFLNKDAQAMAAALYLKTGTLPPLGGGKNAALAKANIMNMAALMNQGKTPEQAANSVFQNKQNRAAEQQALKTFAGGIEGRTKRSMNTATDHLFTLEEAGLALQNGDIRLFNSIGNRINKEIGVAAPTSFDAVKKIVAGEIVKATTGSAGALGDRQEVEASIMSANSPEQLLESINYYKKLMAGQLQSLELQWETGTNRPASEFRQGLSKRTLTLLPPIEKAPAAQKVLSAVDKEALDWANANPSDPRSAQIKQRLGR
jgi:hypothetical protein